MSNPTRTPINRAQLAQVFKDPRTQRAFEQMLDTFTNVQNGSLTFSSGDFKPFAGSTAPDGWLISNGAAVSRTVYSSLYAVIGTTYGAGDGSTTFNLPNLQGRMPIGSTGATGAYPLGTTGGAASVTLNVGQLPSHGHTLTDPGHIHGITDPGHSHPNGAQAASGGSTGAGVQVSDTGIGHTNITINNAQTGITIANTGNGDPVPTMSPYAAITWLIKI